MTQPAAIAGQHPDSAAACRFTVPRRGKFLLWEVSRYCNLECRHCCTDSGPQISTREDLSTTRMIERAGELADIDVVEVLFSGGEPLLHPGFYDVVTAIDTTRVAVFVASNGTTLHDRQAAKLRDAGIAGVDISLDGATAELHADIRLSASSFDRALRGVRAAVAAGLPLRVTSVVTPKTATTVEALVELVAGLGVRTLVLQTMQETGGRASLHTDLYSDAGTVEAVDAAVERARLRFGDRVDVDFRAGESGGGASGCPAGRSLLNVSSNGDVSSCSWLYKLRPDVFTIGNLHHQTFAECLTNATTAVDPWRSLTPGCPLPLLGASR